GRWILAALVDALGGALVQRVVDERALAGPRDPRHARHEPDGELDVDALKVVTRRAAQADHDVRIERPPRRGQRNPPAARQVLARQRRRIRTDLVRRALRDDLAAVRARARAEIDDVIGREDRLAVVLDDHHRVAEVAQVEQRAEQALVVALMQADRRLVEDVHDADEPRADLAGEPDALGFAARERIGTAIEREVAEPDVDEEPDPIRDLGDDLLGDLAAPAADLEAGEELERLGDAEAADLGQRLVGDEDVARRGVQTRAAAARAGLHALILRELLADGVRLGLLVAPLHVRDHAFEAMPAAVLAAALVLVSEDDLLAAAAFEQHLADGLRQRLERLLDVEAVVLRERRDHLEVIRVAAVPAPNRAARERQARVAHDAVDV